MPKRSWWMGLTLVLSACGGPNYEGNPSPNPSTNPGPTGPFVSEPLTAHPTGLPLTLLNRYFIVSEETDNGQTRLRANYGGLRYMPRQADTAGPKLTQFKGWDLLDVPGSSLTRADWLRLNLSRPATVMVVWEKSALWLSGWERSEITVGNKKFNTFTRKFAAGEVQLGAPGTGNGEYWVLLAEDNGQPSAEPALPAGISERPQPNQACPAWLANVWTAKGPDGNTYQSWQPQIDPVYWCYYGHEHGADPKLIGYEAAFLFVAQRFNNQAERGEGFKSFVVRDTQNNVGWYINLHSETSTEQRVCARFHTVVIAATDLKTGEKLLELGYKGDFGASRANNRASGQTENPFFDLTCTDPRTKQTITQSQIAQQLTAEKKPRFERRIRSASVNNSGYEQWDGGVVKELGMTFGGVGIDIDIQNPATACNDLNCQGLITNGGSSSTRRNIRFNNLNIKYNAFLDASDGTNGNGIFYTDAYGVEPRAANAPDAFVQYVKPGVNITLNGGFATEDAWRGLYMREARTMDVELEGGIGAVN